MKLERLRDSCKFAKDGSHRVIADSRDRWVVASHYGLPDIPAARAQQEEKAKKIAQEFIDMPDGCNSCEFYANCMPTAGSMVRPRAEGQVIFPIMITVGRTDSEYLGPPDTKKVN